MHPWDVLSVENLFKIFKSKAALCVWRFITPNSLSFLGKQTNSHAALCGSFAFNICPLPEIVFLTFLVLVYLLNHSFFEAGRWECRENDICDFQSASLRKKGWGAREPFSHLLTRGRQSMTLSFVKLNGRPKQVKGREPTTTQLNDWARVSRCIYWGLV